MCWSYFNNIPNFWLVVDTDRVFMRELVYLGFIDVIFIFFIVAWIKRIKIPFLWCESIKYQVMGSLQKISELQTLLLEKVHLETHFPPKLDPPCCGVRL